MRFPLIWRRLSWPEFVMALAVTVSPASAGELPASRQAELTNLVRQDCGSCHGMTLKGGLGRPITPDQLDGYDSDSLAAIILDGVPGTPMPPWRGLISENDAQWMAEALLTGLQK